MVHKPQSKVTWAMSTAKQMSISFADTQLPKFNSKAYVQCHHDFTDPYIVCKTTLKLWKARIMYKSSVSSLDLENHCDVFPYILGLFSTLKKRFKIHHVRVEIRLYSLLVGTCAWGNDLTTLYKTLKCWAKTPLVMNSIISWLQSQDYYFLIFLFSDWIKLLSSQNSCARNGGRFSLETLWWGKRQISITSGEKGIQTLIYRIPGTFSITHLLHRGRVQ